MTLNWIKLYKIKVKENLPLHLLYALVFWPLLCNVSLDVVCEIMY